MTIKLRSRKHICISLALILFGISTSLSAQPSTKIDVVDLNRTSSIHFNSNDSKTIVYGSEKLNFKTDFKLDFKYRFNPSQLEGMAIVFQNDERGLNASGDSGSCLHIYQCTESGDYINNALSFELDTNYQNVGSTQNTFYGVSDTQIPSKVLAHTAFIKPSEISLDHHSWSDLSLKFGETNIVPVSLEWNSVNNELAYYINNVYISKINISNYEGLFKGDFSYIGFTSSFREGVIAQSSVSDIHLDTNPTSIYYMLNST